MPAPRVLLVEDDPALAELLDYRFKAEGYVVDSTPDGDEALLLGDLKLDVASHCVIRQGRTISLGPTEFRLLKFFMEHPGRVFSRGQLLDAVWTIHADIELRTVDVHIRRLRQGVEIDGALDPVRTVRSAGYSLEAV